MGDDLPIPRIQPNRMRSRKLTETPALTEEQIVTAIMRSGARLSHAADALGVTYAYLLTRSTEEPFATAIRECRERLVDNAEQVIRDAVGGSDIDAAKFVLTRMGKARGWGATEPAVNVSVSATATATATAFGTDPERQARMLEIANRIRESARRESDSN